MINESGRLSFSVVSHFFGGSQPAKTSIEATVAQNIRALIVRKRYPICMKTGCLHPASTMEQENPLWGGGLFWSEDILVAHPLKMVYYLE